MGKPKTKSKGTKRENMKELRPTTDFLFCIRTPYWYQINIRNPPLAGGSWLSPHSSFAPPGDFDMVGCGKALVRCTAALYMALLLVMTVVLVVLVVLVVGWCVDTSDAHRRKGTGWTGGWIRGPRVEAVTCADMDPALTTSCLQRFSCRLWCSWCAGSAASQRRRSYADGGSPPLVLM